MPDIERTIPRALYLCPVHFDEFYVRVDDGPSICPESGCHEEMVCYVQHDAGAVEDYRKVLVAAEGWIVKGESEAALHVLRGALAHLPLGGR